MQINLSTHTRNQILLSLASALCYIIFFNWQAAIIICLTIAWHEQCHIFAAKFRRVKTYGFSLIPFVGGAALIDSNIKSYFDKVIITLAGPLGGGLLAFIVTTMSYFNPSVFICACASLMIIVNLFNLIPIGMLDGGQILNSITYSLNKTLGYKIEIITSIIGVLICLKFSWIIAIILGIHTYKLIDNYQYRYMIYHPRKLSNKEMIVTIISYSLSVILLYGLFHWFESFSPYTFGSVLG